MDNPALLSAQVYESEAFQIHLRFEALATNYFVFERNSHEMMKLLTAVQHSDTFDKLWTQDKREEMIIVLRELTRLLHNLVASAKTLVDHTRRVINAWYADTEFLEEYQQEVEKRFVENPIAGFIEDLRNYALHYQLPPTMALFELTNDPETQEQTATQTIVLNKPDLLQWPRWDKGKPYLDAADERIVLQRVAEQYVQEVHAFHQWMRNRLVEIHAEELKWLEEMSRRVERALNRLRGAT